LLFHRSKRIIEDLAKRMSNYLFGRDFKIPSQSGYGLVKPEEDKEGIIDNETQMLCRSENIQGLTLLTVFENSLK
jgi:hypothetical protein